MICFPVSMNKCGSNRRIWEQLRPNRPNRTQICAPLMGEINKIPGTICIIIMCQTTVGRACSSESSKYLSLWTRSWTLYKCSSRSKKISLLDEINCRIPVQMSASQDRRRKSIIGKKRKRKIRRMILQDRSSKSQPNIRRGRITKSSMINLKHKLMNKLSLKSPDSLNHEDGLEK